MRIQNLVKDCMLSDFVIENEFYIKITIAFAVGSTAVNFFSYIFSYIGTICIYFVNVIFNKVSFWLFKRRYSKYFNDISIKEFNSNESRKYIIGCHGRSKYSVPMTDIIDYSKSLVMTVDINPHVKPHLVCDLSTETALTEFKKKSVDAVALFLCTCCTEKVSKNMALFKNISDILKENGELIIIKANEMMRISDKQSDYNEIIENYFVESHNMTSIGEFFYKDSSCRQSFICTNCMKTNTKINIFKKI